MHIRREGQRICDACGSGGTSDALTGLADRTEFNLALAERLGAAASTEEGAGARDGGACSVLLVDLDRFKSVNDTLGHGSGDALLTLAARRVRAGVRPGDLVARLGGDEFAVLLEASTSADKMEVMALRLIDILSQSYLINGCIATIGASVGGVSPAAGEAPSADDLLRDADLAMYDAKSGGGGRFRLFEPKLRERAEARRLLENDLRAALPLGQFELFYQPQVDVAHDVLAGFEALIRWRHPTRGLVAPDDFIPMLQEIGLIVPVGEWVIRTACQEAMTWPGNYTVAVNVDAQQFDDSRLVAIVQDALRRSGLPSRRLEVEIVETALLRSTAGTLAQLNALKAVGVQVSLDDFGTGYSSLTQLRSFAFDRVKIDRSFVDDTAVLRAITALGVSLGMRTTAEGVETHDQMTRIRHDGCTEAQGYLLSRPVPARDVMALIERFDRYATGGGVGEAALAR